jgi:hypothetical protein
MNADSQRGGRAPKVIKASIKFFPELFAATVPVKEQPELELHAVSLEMLVTEVVMLSSKVSSGVRDWTGIAADNNTFHSEFSSSLINLGFREQGGKSVFSFVGDLQDPAAINHNL